MEVDIGPVSSQESDGSRVKQDIATEFDDSNQEAGFTELPTPTYKSGEIASRPEIMEEEVDGRHETTEMGFSAGNRVPEGSGEVDK